MAKATDAPYEAGRRGFSWLKIKPAHTLDLVVLAAEWGHGRRSGWLSNLHLGARDPENGGFVMLGKTFKGMADETLAWQTKKFQEMALGGVDDRGPGDGGLPARHGPPPHPTVRALRSGAAPVGPPPAKFDPRLHAADHRLR